MTFDKLMKKTYTLLEQDMPQDANKPQDAAMPSEDDTSNEVSSQVEDITGKVLELVDKLVSLLRNQEKIDGVKMPEQISNLLDELEVYSKSPNPLTGLDNIEKAVKNVNDDYIKRPM